MRTRISFIAVVLSWFIISTTFADVISKNQLINKASLIVESGLNSTPLSCLGISKSDFQKTLYDAKISCRELLPEQIQTIETEHYITEFGQCVSNGLMSHFDISQSIIDSCESQKMNAGMPLEEAARRLNKGLKLHATKGDIQQVTLPLYSNYEIVSHFPEGMGNFLGTNSLPVAVLSTNDDINRVIQFYQSQLPSYKQFPVEDGLILIEHAPDNFDLLTHIGLYTSTPHVLIEDMRHTEIKNHQGDVKIEISYRKNK